jgi:non-specific protein-tyrosine kinase
MLARNGKTNMDLSSFTRPLKKWWKLLVAATLLTAIASTVIALMQPPLYEASTTLVIGRAFDEPNPTGNELQIGQQLAQTYADLAQRRSVREQTMAALGLSGLPAYSAVPVLNRELLVITVVDTDPQRAKAVADELANQLVLQSPTAPGPEEQERIDFINGQLTSLQANITQTEAEILAKQAELESAFGARDISQLQSEIWALQNKLTTLQSNYAALLDDTSGGAINTVHVIEPAALPSAPPVTEKVLLIIVASAIALALAAGTAYLLEYMEDTVQSDKDVARVNGQVRLPSIPEFQLNGAAVPVLGHGPHSLPVVDAFRALRTGLYAATSGKPCKVVLVTSAAPQEGKSMIAANLAAVLAQGKKSVLLIDADLRRPKLHALFDVERDNGLADLLVALEGQPNPNSSDEWFQQVIKRVGPMKLGLIVAGANVDEAQGLLGSETMKALLATAARRVDYVIVDSPPLLAVSDAFMLSIQVDCVLLVANAGSTQRKQLEQALRRLHEANANVLGVVLNRHKPDTESYQRYLSAYSEQA